MTLGFILVGIVTLLMALLALPLEFVFRASLSAGGPFERSGRFRWAFGLVDVPLPGGKGRREKMAKPKPEARRKKAKSRRIRRLALNPAVWQRARMLLARLVHAVHWRVFRIEARFGLDDPADTGHLWGVVGALLFMLPPGLDVRVRPAFEGAELTFDGKAEIRFVPLRIIAVLVSFAFSPATLRVLWPMLRNK